MDLKMDLKEAKVMDLKEAKDLETKDLETNWMLTLMNSSSPHLPALSLPLMIKLRLLRLTPRVSSMRSTRTVAVTSMAERASKHSTAPLSSERSPRKKPETPSNTSQVPPAKTESSPRMKLRPPSRPSATASEHPKECLTLPLVLPMLPPPSAERPENLYRSPTSFRDVVYPAGSPCDFLLNICTAYLFFPHFLFCSSPDQL